MTKAEPKPKKLPRLTVEFRDGVAWGVYYHYPRVPVSAYEYHQYVPVQKPKVCRCGTGTYAYSEGYKFCNLCGGKIVTKGDKR